MRPTSAATALLTLMSVTAAGCGSSTKTAVSTKHAISPVQHAPAYRVGQYCQANRHAAYRAAGFTCRHKHLVKR